MSDFSNKLIAIKQQQEKLQQAASKLIDKRKKDIANLAERCDLLLVSDEILTGLFIDGVNAYKNKDSRVKEWQSQGEKFLKPTKSNAKETYKS